jgi:two-component system response regulator AtoC
MKAGRQTIEAGIPERRGHVLESRPTSSSIQDGGRGDQRANVPLAHVRRMDSRVLVPYDALPPRLTAGGAAMEAVLDSIRRNGIETLTGPTDFAHIKRALHDLTRTLHKKMSGTIEPPCAEPGPIERLGLLIGHSPAMQQVYGLIGHAARSNATVLITGETGTGKELVAETIHALSSRSSEPFLPVNCGAVSSHVAESELFGHERGSFTGADRVHKGFFEQASRGTLFLDEIAETPVELQVKLLRVLESGEVTRIGGSQSMRVDLRLIAATNRLLPGSVALGKLRADLFYRLNVFPIHVPPLRERSGDAERLADHFLNELNAAEGTSKELTPAFRKRLQQYNWPGNVRELKNVVGRTFILADDVIDADLWPARVDGAASGPLLKVGASMAEMERALILSTLGQFHGDKKKAAAVLKISAKTLYNRLREYRI